MMKRELPCMAGQSAALEIMDGHSSQHPAFSFPMLVGVSAPSGERVCSQIRSCLLPDSDASAPRFADKDRARKGGLGVRVGRLKSKTEVGREATAPLKGRVFKIVISKVSGSVLVAEICTGPHNRLLRRQHCSSLCSQSEGHEHVANMTNALGHDFVGFSVLVRHNIRPPHFASKVSYSASPQASAKCPRGAPFSDAAFAMLFGSKPRRDFFLYFGYLGRKSPTPRDRTPSHWSGCHVFLQVVRQNSCHLQLSSTGHHSWQSLLLYTPSVP